MWVKPLSPAALLPCRCQSVPRPPTVPVPLPRAKGPDYLAKGNKGVLSTPGPYNSTPATIPRTPVQHGHHALLLQAPCHLPRPLPRQQHPATPDALRLKRTLKNLAMSIPCSGPLPQHLRRDAGHGHLPGQGGGRVGGAGGCGCSDGGGGPPGQGGADGECPFWVYPCHAEKGKKEGSDTRGNTTTGRTGKGNNSHPRSGARGLGAGQSQGMGTRGAESGTKTLGRLVGWDGCGRGC